MISDMTVFAAVIDRGSISAGARQLGLRKSTVSQRLMQMEARLGVRLLDRSSRAIRPTEAGRLYFSYCQRVVAETEAAEAALASLQAEPRGVLRISVTQPFAEVLLGRLMHEFAQRHPQVRVEALVADRYLNLIDEGIDVAVRLGPLEDSSLVARRVARVGNVLCASPDYVARRRPPVDVEALTEHDCIGYGVPGSRPRWAFVGPEGPQSPRLEGRLMVNNHLAAKHAAMAGLGITLLPDFLCSDALAEGSLVQLLGEWMPPPRDFFLVYPSHRQLSTKVRAFIDFMAQALERSSIAAVEHGG